MDFETFLNEYASRKDNSLYEEGTLKNCCEIYCELLKQQIITHSARKIDSEYGIMLVKKYELEEQKLILELQYQMNSLKKQKAS